MFEGTTQRGRPPEAPSSNNPPGTHRRRCCLSLIATVFMVTALATGLSCALRRYSEVTTAPWFPPLLVLISTLFTAVWMRYCRARATTQDSHYKDILDSAGAAFMVITPDGGIPYLNPAAERLLGYHGSELTALGVPRELFAPGETDHLVRAMESHCGFTSSGATGSRAMLEAYLHCVHALPPSRVPNIQLHLQRKDGTTRPVTLQVSAYRDAQGAERGLIAVATDDSSTLHREEQLRDLQETYNELFDHTADMIAILSPAGRFLYANPSWKSCFGLDDQALQALDSFEELLAPGYRSEAMRLFRAALEGKTVQHEPLCHHTPDGRVLNVELNLSLRQTAGKPIAVRCMLRDVTQQKQREHRLALQLAISQIVGENEAPLSAARRVLEALSLGQIWNLAVLWMVDAGNDHLEFGTGWSASDPYAEHLLQQSMALNFVAGEALAGKAWQQAQSLWIADLDATTPSLRLAGPQEDRMRSGWAVPIRADQRVLAVLEFYSHLPREQNREILATIEMAAAALGQLLARSEEQGRAQELARRQEVLLDAIAEAVCGLDRNGIVRFANPAASRLLATPDHQLIGRSLHELLHAAAAEEQRCDEHCPLLNALDAHQLVSGETRINCANGVAFPAEFALTPILERGHFSGAVLSFRDISHRNALDRLKDEFISTVSHELRTPLTSIRGALGLLNAGMLGPINDKAANLLRIAQTNSDRLIRLINDILDLERIQSGREPLSFRPVRLDELVRQAIEGIAPTAEGAGVLLLHDATRIELAADPDRLLQVLTNLLSNAVKFSPAGATVAVMLHPEVDGVTLSVIDHGRGIPADKLETIFGRFQQVDASDARQKGGSGLGLAICRTIVAQHAGRIWAERNPVCGATFRVYLPYHPTAGTQ